MSAWDVAGAVVWTPLALMYGSAPFMNWTTEDQRTAGFRAAVPLTLAAVFCIARLAGAHA